MATKNNIKTKIDPVILHTTPFLPTHNRKKNYYIERKWGTRVLMLRAKETLNGYDLITLLQLIKDYIQNKSNWETIGETLEKGKFILRRKIDISDLARERGSWNKTSSRKSILNSIERWVSVDVQMTNEKDNSKINTKYIYELKITDKSFKSVELLVNQLFFDFCIKRGLVVNLDRLIAYKHETTVLLDVFIQSTRFQQYNEEILFERCGLNETSSARGEKRRILKKIFNEFNKSNEVRYFFNKQNNKWERETAIQKRETAIQKPARNSHRQKGLISI